MGEDFGGVATSAMFWSLGKAGACFSSIVTSSFLTPDTDLRLFVISALTRALASAKFLASNAGLGRLMDPGTFSLFLFLPASL